MVDKSIRVLLIDDDEDFVRFNKAFLERSCAVDVAYNGREGIARAREARPDVIILDMMMDDIDEGFNVARTLRADPQLDAIPIIVLSGVNRILRPLHFDVDQKWLPVNVFLDKPVSPERLMVEIDRLVRGRS